jgi:hypothetical protein
MSDSHEPPVSGETRLSTDVSIKVKYQALQLKNFTIKTLVEATGENGRSVGSAVKRLEERGAVRQTAPGGGRGKEAKYEVLDHEVWTSLDAAFAMMYPSPPANGSEPEGDAYNRARAVIQLASEVSGADLVAPLLRQAEEYLDEAFAAEGYLFSSESVRACLAFEEARIAFMRGDSKRFDRLAADLLSCFDEASDRRRILAAMTSGRDRELARFFRAVSKAWHQLWADNLLNLLKMNPHKYPMQYGQKPAAVKL